MTDPVPELWCVHIPGPDDIYAHPDRAAADKHAAEFNAAMQGYWQRHPRTENDPTEAGGGVNHQVVDGETGREVLPPADGD